MEKQQIVRLQSGDYQAEINITRGANCISLRNKKYNAKLLREPDYSKELDNPYLYGMPILFPVNRILGGRFEFEGREYVFPINEPLTGCHLHGELHKTAFDLVEKSERRVVCSYKADVNTPYLFFPHEFEIRIIYELHGHGLQHTTEVFNYSDYNMPILLGFHTTFYAAFTEESRMEDINVLVDISDEYERNMKNYLPTGVKSEFDETSRALRYGIFNPCAKATSRHYRADEDGRMIIYDKGRNLSVVYENDEKYGFRLIYNGNADEYICLEPQTCMANCPNTPFDRTETGFDYIAPGESKRYVSKIYITEGDKR